VVHRQELFANLSEQAIQELTRLPLVNALVSFLRNPQRLAMGDRSPANNVA
jgi:hypothetical protein